MMKMEIEKRPEETFMYSHRQHAVGIVQTAFPIILSELFQNTLPVVDIAFVGSLLSKEDLAAAALATVWFNLWNDTMMGFMTAIDTFLAQTFGAGELDSFSSWAGNSLMIVLVASVVVSAMVAICEPFMLIFGQNEAISRQAGQFAYRLLIGLPPLYIFKALTKYLQAQDILYPCIYIGILANGINVAANYLLISKFKQGINGAPLATSITRWIELIVILAYIIWNKSSKLKNTFPSFDRSRFRWNKLLHFLKLALSGAFSFSAEAWSFEVTTILAGLLGTISLDAHTITLSIATFIFMSFPFSIGIATSIRVGQLIGEGRSDDAKRSCFVSYGINLGLQLILIALLLGLMNPLSRLFSKEDEISSLVKKLLPLSSFFMLGDAIQANTGGALRGLGRQQLAFQLNFLGYWVLAIPTGALLTFVADIGVAGLWWGFTVGIYSAAIIGLILLRSKVNWGNEAIKARSRSSIINN